MKILIGNIIALLAALILLFGSFFKSKKKILFYQTLNIALLGVSNLILGGVVGFINNIINILRNVLCYKDKLNLTCKIIISFMILVITLCCGKLNLINTFPSINGLIYLWLMDVKSEKKFKLLISFIMFQWFFYDFYIKSYVGAIFDLSVCLVNMVFYFKIKEDKII